MKTSKEVKDLLTKAEKGNSEAIKEIVEDLQVKLDYIETLDKDKKAK